jgi:RNA polymerase sigma-70 factor (ECF subfamily)
MDEQQLVARAKSGDFDAFNALINMHKGRIFALAARMTGNEQDAEDIVQDTFIKAIDKIDQFRGDASFGTWLYSIALNESRAALSRQKQTDLADVEDYLPSGGTHTNDTAGAARLFDWDDPHKALENEELRRIIDELIAELPYKYRAAFILRYQEELSIKEVARLIKESEAATKSRVLRARLALRDKLSKIFEDRYGQGMSQIH